LRENLNEIGIVGHGNAERSLQNAYPIVKWRARIALSAGYPATCRTVIRSVDHLQPCLSRSESTYNGGLGVVANHVFDITLGGERRRVSVVIRAYLPSGGQSVALHVKPVGVRLRRYPQRLVSVNIILDVARQLAIVPVRRIAVWCGHPVIAYTTDG
jgi:hypothetical protein